MVRPGHGKILNLAVMTSINPVERVCEHSDHKGPCTSQRKHGALDDRLSRTITAWPWSQMVANLCVVSRCSLTDWRLAKGSGGDHLVANLGHDLDKAQRGLRQRTERGRIRSDERRVGKECVSTVRDQWSRLHKKKKKHEIINN